MFDLTLSILLGLSVTVLSVWGGIVSAKSLPENENKPFHFWMFIVVGVVAFALSIGIGIRNFYSQKDGARQQIQLHEELQSALSKLAADSRSLDNANQTCNKVDIPKSS